MQKSKYNLSKLEKIHNSLAYYQLTVLTTPHTQAFLILIQNYYHLEKKYLNIQTFVDASWKLYVVDMHQNLFFMSGTKTREETCMVNATYAIMLNLLCLFNNEFNHSKEYLAMHAYAMHYHLS